MIRSPMEQFEIISGIGTNIGISMIIGIMGLRMIMRKGGRIIGGRWEVVSRGIYKGIIRMVYETIGKGGGEYVVVVFSIVTIIGMWNIMGLVPYGYTVTTQIAITMGLSMWVWIGKGIIGGKKHGIRIVGILLPAGAPIVMSPFFVLLEIASFIIPIISLAVRLFANMLSGHILLKVLLGFGWTMIMTKMMMMNIGLMVVIYLLIGLEVGVAMIQGYVFGLLTCIYIGDMERGGH